MPVSMIVVQTSTCVSPLATASMTLASTALSICPCATPIVTLLELLLQLARRAFNIVDAVVQVVDLAAALDLAPDRVGHQAPVVLHDEGLHRQAVLRRLLDGGHVADAGHGHVQRAGDGRGRERQHVHAAAELLDVLLVRHAEALLLVHDQQAEILELHVLAQQPVRADHEVALAGGEVGERLALWPPVLKRLSTAMFTGKPKKRCSAV